MSLHSILRRPAVKAATGLGDSSIYEKIAEEIFPRPLDLGAAGGAVGWPEDEIIAYIDVLKAARDGRLDAWLAARKAERGELEGWVVNLANKIGSAKRRGRRRAA